METLCSPRVPSLGDRFARQQLLGLFDHLEGAGLTLIEAGQRLHFGDPDAELQAEIAVLDPRAWRAALFGGSIGAAEAWVLGYWDTPDLTRVTSLFVHCQPLLERLEKRLAWLSAPLNRLRHWINRNSKNGSRSNIAAHYDLGNELYRLFLDPWMQYSSAIFPEPGASLDQAQEHKLKLICEKLELGPADHLLEIGSGWGGLAIYAASHYGCRVTTTTLSQAQFEHAKAEVAAAGLEDKVTLLLKDYRDLDGQYDKLVSVEMIEAVGHHYLPTYFQALERLLKPRGKLLIQAICIADQRYDQYRKEVDFIQRYIFPGGCLPSVSTLCQQLKEQTSMTLTRLQDYGHHYAHTLKLWAERFRGASDHLQALGYEQEFQRLWAFYFAYCEGGFREGAIGLVHFEAAKPEARKWPAGTGFNC